MINIIHPSKRLIKQEISIYCRKDAYLDESSNTIEFDQSTEIMYDGSFESLYDNNVDDREHRFGVVQIKIEMLISILKMNLNRFK